MEDARILDLYFARDQEAIRETDRKYGPFCLRIAMNILSCFQDSEECVSDAYGKTWDTIPPTRPDSLRAYLGRIVRNLSLSRYRARLPEQERTPAGEYEARLASCRECPELVNATCNLCGCYVEIRAARRSSSCPATPPRWGGAV